MSDTTLATTSHVLAPLQIMHWREGLARLHGNDDTTPCADHSDLIC